MVQNLQFIALLGIAPSHQTQFWNGVSAYNQLDIYGVYTELSL